MTHNQIINDLISQYATAQCLAHCRHGFTRSPELDKAFALGWPEIRWVTAASEKEIAASIHGQLRLVYSRPTAYLRIKQLFDNASIRISAENQLALNIDRSEALQWFRHVIAFGVNGSFDEVQTDLYLLEALVGSDIVADVMISAIEELSRNEWQRVHRSMLQFYYLLGFIVLRLSSDQYTLKTARLQTLFEKRKLDEGVLYSAVDLILNGGQAVRRSAPRWGTKESDIDPMYALLAFNDHELINAIVTGERIRRYDRRFAARLAFLGDQHTLSAIAQHWYEVGNQVSQLFFLGTAGQITNPEMIAPTQEAVRLSKITEVAKAWLDDNNIMYQPLEKSTSLSFLDGPLDWAPADEFGYVLLSEQAATKLIGEDDHSRLTEESDPNSAQAHVVEIYSEQAIVVCLADKVTAQPIEDGAIIALSGSSEQPNLSEIIERAETEAWRPCGILTLKQPGLVGQSASLTYAQAKDDRISLALPTGKYELRQWIDEDICLPTLLWLRKIS